MLQDVFIFLNNIFTCESDDDQTQHILRVSYT